MGTGATTTFNLNDRGVGANVVTDSNGAVKLDSSTPENDIVTQNSSGELEIDFANGGAGGVNIGSVVNVGNYNNPNRSENNDGDPAFRIVNQTTSDIDLEIDFVPGDNYNVENTDGSVLRFAVERNSFGALRTEISDTENAVNGWRSDGSAVSPGSPVQIFDLDKTVDTLGAGAQVFVALQVDADQDGSSTDDNLTGALNITATQPQDAA